MVCLGHRHQSEHSCANLQEVARPMQATSEVVKVTSKVSKVPFDKKFQGILASAPEKPTTPRKPRSVKAQKTAAKVQLMKLKMKSKAGDNGLPQEERVYLLVSLPKALQKQPQGTWVGTNKK